MGELQRFNFDVTGTVDVSNPKSVCAAVIAILRGRYDGIDTSTVESLFTEFARLYRGQYPGFFACDTQYHDMQHVLDVTLATARLIDGYEIGQPLEKRLGRELAILGVAIALFHDSGYIRRRGDSRHQFGAEYTRTHVSRSARFLREFLPTIGLDTLAPIAAKLVHYTGYEFDPATMHLTNPKWHMLGTLIGSADVLAQMADPGYLEKCRDRLFHEFELGGITRELDANGAENIRYASPADLLKQTPAFIRHTLNERLDALFGGAYRYFSAHFGGYDPYSASLERNRVHLERLLQQYDDSALQSLSLRF
ncbi:MAG: hypothetical protein JWM78_791 [Verrucomicrobiaceae bacterium]|nr:hypothetical protein [Verrucomicrobiaceae bacterium]